VTKNDTSRLLRDIGRKVAELRRGLDLTQEQLAERIEVSARHLQNVEAGRENLTVGSMARIADGLGVALRALFTAPRSRTVRPGRPRRPTARGR
jgi:transcriptional regulator with XRE-family HTH domain